MLMFALGMLIMWVILGGLIYANDYFEWGGGMELWDGWLCYVVTLPWFIILLPFIFYYKLKIKKH